MVKQVGYYLGGATGSRYSRWRNRHDHSQGKELVDKHPTRLGQRKIYRRVGNKLVPTGYTETAYKNFHGRDTMNTAYYNKAYGKKRRR